MMSANSSDGGSGDIIASSPEASSELIVEGNCQGRERGSRGARDEGEEGIISRNEGEGERERGAQKQTVRIILERLRPRKSSQVIPDTVVGKRSSKHRKLLPTRQGKQTRTISKASDSAGSVKHDSRQRDAETNGAGDVRERGREDGDDGGGGEEEGEGVREEVDGVRRGMEMCDAVSEEGETREDDSLLPHVPKLRRTKAIHIHTTGEPSFETLSLSITSTDSPSNKEDTEYPPPSTNYQKTERRLARQRQLEEMRAREAAWEREERLMRRQGLSRSPETKKKKSRTGGGRHIAWREGTDLVEVFSYSPCSSSSRGSTLEPEEIP